MQSSSVNSNIYCGSGAGCRVPGAGAEDEHRRKPKIKWKLLINYLQEINYDRLLPVKLPTYDVSTGEYKLERENRFCKSIPIFGWHRC